MSISVTIHFTDNYNITDKRKKNINGGYHQVKFYITGKWGALGGID